jgi:hypothetical protein
MRPFAIGKGWNIAIQVVDLNWSVLQITHNLSSRSKDTLYLQFMPTPKYSRDFPKQHGKIISSDAHIHPIPNIQPSLRLLLLLPFWNKRI